MIVPDPATTEGFEDKFSKQLQSSNVKNKISINKCFFKGYFYLVVVNLF